MSPSLAASNSLSETGSAQNHFQAEIRSGTNVGQFANAWRDLAFRSLEANVFFEPDFAIPALAHLNGGTSVEIACVWDDCVTPRRLVGILPFAPQPVLPGIPLSFGCRAWVHDQAVLGAPLIDCEMPDEIFETLLTAVRDHKSGHAILLLPLISTSGPLFALFKRAAAKRNQDLALFDRHERAILRRPFKDPLSSGPAKELRRQARRLADIGPLVYKRRENPADVAEGLEAFLALEAQGWKGRRKSALAAAHATNAFVRDLAHGMSQAGKMAIDSLELDGRPIAMGIILKSGDCAYFWKICYDEDHAARSPGVLFTRDLTQRQLADAAIAVTDSCAKANHPMIDRLWPDRVELADVAFPLHGGKFSIGLALTAERLRRELRANLKSAVLRLRKRR